MRELVRKEFGFGENLSSEIIRVGDVPEGRQLPPHPDDGMYDT